MAKILILEDNLEVVNTMKGMLTGKGHQVDTEENPEQVMKKIRQFEPDLVTLDISFSEEKDETGIALLQSIRESYSQEQLPVLVISGTANADKITRMILNNISGYLPKPVSLEDLQKKINDVLDTKAHRTGPAAIWETGMVGESPAILELILETGKAAVAESDLLITGESGTGKEQIVQKYRELSPRKNKPFVIVNCTTIHKDTFESQIFGHEKGTFTSALELKKGEIEAGNGGIIVFDEIGELPLDIQPKFLRLLQDKKYTRMGTRNPLQPLQIDAVILAVTHRNLFELMKRGHFREDLYYRLKYINIEMPPLRDHLGDIPLLVDHFIRKANRLFRKSVVAAEPGVIQAFQKMRWNGNVRQLEKCVEQGVVTCEGPYLKWGDVAGFFKDEIRSAGQPSDTVFDRMMPYPAFKKFLKEDRDAKEKEYYCFHLQRNHYNVKKTAEALGVARPHLRETLERLGIKKPVDF
jgi:DNA-binding NtrC family response regulator